MKKAFFVLCTFLMSAVFLSGCAVDNRDIPPAVPTPILTPAPGFGADQGQMTPIPGTEIQPGLGGAGTGTMGEADRGVLGGG